MCTGYRFCIGTSGFKIRRCKGRSRLKNRRFNLVCFASKLKAKRRNYNSADCRAPIKLKTGSTADTDNAIDTTDLLLSYKGTARGEKLQVELENWRNAIRICILVSTAEEIQENLSIQKNLRKRKNVPNDRELFLICGPSKTKVLFGEMFVNLAGRATSPPEKRGNDDIFELYIHQRKKRRVL